MTTGVGGPSVQDIERAAVAGRGVVRETPVLSSRTLSERVGGIVVLKAENLQRTGSFKLRGALAKISSLGDRCRDGVVTGSAGNHAQAVAYAAGIRGLRCEVYMPETAATAKVDAAVALGADVRPGGKTVDDCLAAAKERARTGNLEFIHAFDDPEVVAGQGTLGLELLEQIPDIERVVVPVGGGGLISGVAIALKAARADVEVIGVQVEACAAFPPSLAAGEALTVSSALTIADGIAIKRPGGLTLELVRRLVDDMVVVPEDDVAEAMVLLMERAKLVVEGAGAVGVAALLSGLAPASGPGKTVAILSGGNVDAGVLATIARRHESLAGHRLVLLARIPDLPGGLAGVLSLVAARGANLIDVQHVREGFDLHVRETVVQLVLETRGPEHAEGVSAAVRQAGYSEPRLLK